MANLLIELVPDSNTSQVRQCATCLERACRVWGVNEFVKPIRDHAAVRGTELENDANVAHAIIRSNAVLLCNLHRCGEDGEFASTYLGVSTTQRIEAQIRNMRNNNRLSFAAMANFCLEWMLRDVVTRLGKCPERNFYPLARQAIQLVDFPRLQEHLNALTVVSRLRNSLHNRGYYQGQSSSFDLEGVNYEFKDREIVKDCATWDHIVHGLACALKSIRQMINGFPA
jgi:hypothetical protein